LPFNCRIAFSFFNGISYCSYVFQINRIACSVANNYLQYQAFFKLPFTCISVRSCFRLNRPPEISAIDTNRQYHQSNVVHFVVIYVALELTFRSANYVYPCYLRATLRLSCISSQTSPVYFIMKIYNIYEFMMGMWINLPLAHFGSSVRSV